MKKEGGMGFKVILILVVSIPVVLILIGGALLPTIQSTFHTSSVSAATEYLEGKSYVVFSAAEYALLAKEATAYAAVQNADAAAEAAALAASNAADAVVAAQATLDTLKLHNENEVFLWPESVQDTCTLRAGLVADTFGAWAQIVDNHNVTLATNFTANDGYLVEIMTHDYSSLSYDTIIIELATDAAGANVIGRVKTITDWTYIVALRSEVIPHGSSIYYRMKSETGNSTLQADFRYYYG